MELAVVINMTWDRSKGISKKAAMKVVSEDAKAIKVTEKDLEEYLGVPRYHPERQALEERVGVVNGLARGTAPGPPAPPG